MSIEFRDPPAASTGRRKGTGKHAAIADALRARPNEWALIMTAKSNANATQIKAGILSSYQPAGSFDAVARRNGDGWDIYARYVGGGETA